MEIADIELVSPDKFEAEIDKRQVSIFVKIGATFAEVGQKQCECGVTFDVFHHSVELDAIFDANMMIPITTEISMADRQYIVGALVKHLNEEMSKMCTTCLSENVMDSVMKPDVELGDVLTIEVLKYNPVPNHVRTIIASIQQ